MFFNTPCEQLAEIWEVNEVGTIALYETGMI